MRIKHLFAYVILGGLLAAGCEKAPEPTLPGEAGYVGTLEVIEINDELFRIEGLKTSYTLDAVTGQLDIYLYDVSFSSRMPVLLSKVVIPDIDYTRNGGTLTLRDTDIIPLMESRGVLVPYDRHVCTDLTGTVTADRMVLSMKLGGFQTDYTGLYSE